MKKYLFITILAITLTTTGVAMASTGETPIDVIMKLLRFLKTDVEQLQTKAEAIQNQVNGIKSDTNLKVFDATGKEIGILHDGVGVAYYVFDTNINKFISIRNLKNPTISALQYIREFWFESENCTGTPLEAFNETDVIYDPYVSYGQDYGDKYYTFADYDEGELNSRLDYNDNWTYCVKMKNPYQNYTDWYKAEEFIMPTYEAPLIIEVK